jgi:hypothetical protein
VVLDRRGCVTRVNVIPYIHTSYIFNATNFVSELK